MNKYQAVMDFLKECPLVGEDMYFNFIDETNNDGNTSLLSVPNGQLVRKYVDGGGLYKMQFEIRQTKPLTKYSNTTANTEQLQKVKDFLDWINNQGKEKKYPIFGNGCTIQSMKTPDGVIEPSVIGRSDTVMLYGFPFEISYTERK